MVSKCLVKRRSWRLKNTVYEKWRVGEVWQVRCGVWRASGDLRMLRILSIVTSSGEERDVEGLKSEIRRRWKVEKEGEAEIVKRAMESCF